MPSRCIAPPDEIVNVADWLARSAERAPDQPAVAEPHAGGWRQLTYAELDADVSALASGLRNWGVPRGSRIALLVPPGIEFVTLAFAALRAGLVVVLVDPGMGRRRALGCVAETRPAGFIATPMGHLARTMMAWRFSQSRWNIVVGRWPGCVSIERLRQLASQNPSPPNDVRTSRADDAAIIFTSGSTGPAKGVLYRHGHFIWQAYLLREHFQLADRSIHLSAFPLFALFNAASATTTVFPPMDFTRPADVDPQRFAAAVAHWQADQAFGSPALWNTVSADCLRRGVRLESLRKVFSAGAPVPVHVLERTGQAIAADGEIFTPYGATESLPVASNSARVILTQTAAQTRRGAGTCVGSRIPPVEWRVIRVTDDPIPTIDQTAQVGVGEIGELIVTGPVVTDRYVVPESANALHKVRDGDRVWHRMGDVGYLDEQDRFWFCGRKSQRVEPSPGEVMWTIPCESIFNTHRAIYRSALVGVGPRGQQRPVIIAEPWPDQFPATRAARRRLVDELLELGAQSKLTRHVRDVLLRRRLPTDIRHNSKIFRERLATWAARRVTVRHS